MSRGPGGGLVSVTDAGAVELQLANLHGDIVATATTAATGPASYSETTEYGLPRAPAVTNRRYGWLGAHQRNTGDTLAQITLMGVRLYNATTGRFLSIDPVAGGSCNDYEYTCADPINGRDLDGKKCWKWASGICGAVKKVYRHRENIVSAVAVAGLFACTVCAFVAGGVALYGAVKMTNNIKNDNYRAAAWDAVGLATFGYGKRAARGYRMSVRAGQAWRAKGSAIRSRTYIRGSYRYNSRAARYQRQARAARWADYGHWAMSAAHHNRSY